MSSTSLLSGQPLIAQPLPCATGYLELNLPVTLENHHLVDQPARVSCIATAFHLGYDGIAWNTIVHSRATIEPPAAIPNALFLSESSSSSSSSSSSLPSSSASTITPHQILRLTNMRSFDHRAFQQYSRVTYQRLNPSDTSTFNTIAHNSLFDIVAFEPTDANSFLLACTHLNVDLIVLAISSAQRLPYRLTPSLVRAAIARGVCFEVLYAPALRDDAAAKRNLFSSIASVVRFTKGKNLLLSSGALQALELRSPFDVMNLASLFGIPADRAKAIVTSNCHLVLNHGIMRRGYAQSVVISK